MGLVLSPRDFYGVSAIVRRVYGDGRAHYGGFADSFRGVRPVLSLKSGSLTQGQGTASDPYLV